MDFSDAALAAMNQTKAMASAFADDADALKQNFLLRGFFNRRGYEDSNELKENKISQLPSQPSDKEFAYDAKEIFDKSDNAKLKNEKALDAAGKFLEQNKFRLAVVATSSEVGDAKKDRVLTQARAKVVRDFGPELQIRRHKTENHRSGKVDGSRRKRQGGNPRVRLEV